MKRYIHSNELIYNDIQLVPATEDDLDLIIEAELYMGQEPYGDKHMPKTVEDEIIQDSIDSVDHTRIILSDDVPIGILQAYPLEGYWYIGAIYLIDEYRGQGIGRAVLEHEIENHDDMVICLNVYKSNSHAIQLYVSLGFEITEDDDNRYIMKLFPDNY